MDRYQITRHAEDQANWESATLPKPKYISSVLASADERFVIVNPGEFGGREGFRGGLS